jgi:HEAT repeat protein
MFGQGRQRMKKRTRNLLLVLLGLGFVAVVWAVVRPREPAYHGKALSFWLEEYYATLNDKEANEENAKALRAIGTNAFPQMLKMLGSRQPAYKRKANALLRRLHVGNYSRDQKYAHDYAAYAFQAFGPDAQPAVPGLAALLDVNDFGVQIATLEALKYIGPAASNAAPALTRHMQDADIVIRDEAAKTLKVVAPSRN